MNNENSHNAYFYIPSPNWHTEPPKSEAVVFSNSNYCEYCEDTTTYD